jgi:hypothetical protein
VACAHGTSMNRLNTSGHIYFPCCHEWEPASHSDFVETQYVGPLPRKPEEPLLLEMRSELSQFLVVPSESFRLMTERESPKSRDIKNWLNSEYALYTVIARTVSVR